MTRLGADLASSRHLGWIFSAQAPATTRYAGSNLGNDLQFHGEWHAVGNSARQVSAVFSVWRACRSAGWYSHGVRSWPFCVTWWFSWD